MVAFAVTKITIVKKGYYYDFVFWVTYYFSNLVSIDRTYLEISKTRVLSFGKTDCEFVLLALSQILIPMLSQRKLRNQKQAAMQAMKGPTVF